MTSAPDRLPEAQCTTIGPGSSDTLRRKVSTVSSDRVSFRDRMVQIGQPRGLRQPALLVRAQLLVLAALLHVDHRSEAFLGEPLEGPGVGLRTGRLVSDR